MFEKRISGGERRIGTVVAAVVSGLAVMATFGASASATGPSMEPGPDLNRTPELTISKKAIRKDRPTLFKVSVGNPHEIDLMAVRTCVRAPRKAISGSLCKKLGQLPVGSSKTVKFKLRAKKRAVSGRKYAADVLVSGIGLSEVAHRRIKLKVG